MTNIVIITRDRFKLLTQTLETLRRNTNRDEYTLTIVDDGSVDFRCVKRLSYESLIPHTTVLRIENSRHNIGELKNLGVAATRAIFGEGDYLYLSDNDVYFTADWLSTIREHAHSTFLQGFRLWGGQIHPFHKPCLNGPSLLESNNPIPEYEVLDGVSWFMSWSTWNGCGPFVTTGEPGPGQSEEYPFCKRLRSQGDRIGVTPQPVVIHTGLTHMDGSKIAGWDQMPIYEGVIYA